VLTAGEFLAVLAVADGRAGLLVGVVQLNFVADLAAVAAAWECLGHFAGAWLGLGVKLLWALLRSEVRLRMPCWSSLAFKVEVQVVMKELLLGEEPEVKLTPEW